MGLFCNDKKLESIERMLMSILKRLRFGSAIRIDSIENKGVIDSMVNIVLTNEQKVKVTLSPKTAAGSPAVVDGTPSWDVDFGDVDVEVSSDGLSAWIFAGEVGDSLVVVTADADLGEGIVEISEQFSIRVDHALASNLGATVGDPVLK